MLFNSYIFIFLFFPFFLAGYYVLLHRGSLRWLLIFTSVLSLIFYGYYRPEYALILIGSIGINFYLGSRLVATPSRARLWFGILFNIAVLGVFKYTDFILENINILSKADYPLLSIALPLGISFYTFQQISFLHSCYKKEINFISFYNYSTFVSFFPQLIAGPIVEYNEIVPQYNKLLPQNVDWDVIARGLFLFSLGLFKKTIIADSLAQYANAGFDNGLALSFAEGWITSLSYTLQLYFDFSGYSDMAVGLGAMLLICLPENFNSPYRSSSIQEFWRRWHITLGRFVMNCMYIPLGGNRKGPVRTILHLILVFFVIGLWHGAGWLFILWGLAHGVAVAICHLWKRYGRPIPPLLGGIATFLFVNFAWVLFRAETLFDAKKIYVAMLTPNGWFHPFSLATLSSTPWQPVALVAGAFALTMVKKNSMDIFRTFHFSPKTLVAAACMLFASFLTLLDGNEFIYFNF